MRFFFPRHPNSHPHYQIHPKQSAPEVDTYPMAGSHSAFPPPPEDLTNGIVKLEDQYSEAGCFGDVYKCLYISSTGHKEVAVKAFRFKFRVDTSGMARRELGIWRRLDHPNIVPFLGIATGFGMIGSKSLVSLWMQNGTLESFLGDYKNLEIDHRLRLLLDIANGLCYLHSFPLCFSSSSSPDPKPIVHGDLNPANVLLDDKYTARLVDFGYASMVGEIPEALFYLKRSTRRPGALRWNAPEQVWSKSGEVQRTTESDVYSFGCIALQVLSGKPPWSELGEDVAVILQLSQGNTPSPPASRPIDAQYWELIERCLLPISERPAANIIVSAFEQFLEDFPPSKPLRDVIALLSSQNSQQSDASDSMFSTSFTCPGDEGIDKVWPDRDDQRISDSSNHPYQSDHLNGSIEDAFGVGQSPSTSLTARSEGFGPFTTPTKGLPSLWITRIPRE